MLSLPDADWATPEGRGGLYRLLPFYLHSVPICGAKSYHYLLGPHLLASLMSLWPVDL